MKIKRLKDLKVANWSGGTTTELLIFPETANYADRDFLFRISSAVVEDEHSVFTSLPDYERILMVLDGDVELSHKYEGENSVVSLGKQEQTRFSGKWHTESNGKITDFNVIYQPSLQADLKQIVSSVEMINSGTFVFVWCQAGSVHFFNDVVDQGSFSYGFLNEDAAIEFRGSAILVTINGTLP